MYWLVLFLLFVLRSLRGLQATPVWSDFVGGDDTAVLCLKTGTADGDARAGAQQSGNGRRLLGPEANDDALFEQRAPQFALGAKQRQPHDALGFHPSRLAPASVRFALIFLRGAVIDNYVTVVCGKRDGRNNVRAAGTDTANADRIANFDRGFDLRGQVGAACRQAKTLAPSPR